MFTGTMVQKIWLMHAVASTLSSTGGVALANRVLSWLERGDPVSLSHIAWRLDPCSFVLGLLVGVALVLCIEAWFTFRWCLATWFGPDRQGPHCTVPRPRGLPKPAYKLC